MTAKMHFIMPATTKTEQVKSLLSKEIGGSFGIDLSRVRITAHQIRGAEDDVEKLMSR